MPLRFTTISFFWSREKTTWWSVLRFHSLHRWGGLLHPRSEWRGLWLFECRHVSVRQLMMWTLATICRAPIRGRKSLLGYLQPLPPTHIAHTCAECCRWHRCMKGIKQLIKKQQQHANKMLTHLCFFTSCMHFLWHSCNIFPSSGIRQLPQDEGMAIILIFDIHYIR